LSGEERDVAELLVCRIFSVAIVDDDGRTLFILGTDTALDSCIEN
jgi:hypothetical protein